MSIMTIWEHNGQQFELDLQEVETSKRYEDAFQRMKEDETLVPRTGSVSEILRAYCMMYINLFDALFGDGASKLLMGNKVSATLCEDAYESLLAFVSKQKEASQARRERMVATYSLNRAQRRGKG